MELFLLVSLVAAVVCFLKGNLRAAYTVVGSGFALIAAIDGLSYQWLFMEDRVLLTRTADAVRETWVRGIRR